MKKEQIRIAVILSQGRLDVMMRKDNAMRFLRVIGKIAVLPVLALLAMLWLAVKALVKVFSFARGIAVVLCVILILAVIVTYKDWVQAAFLAGLAGISLVVLVAGVWTEVMLENTCRGLMQFIAS